MRRPMMFVWALVLGSFLGCDGGDDDEAGAQGPDDRGDCDAMLECAERLYPSMYPALDGSYGEDGACWADPADWDSCRAACTDTLADLDEIAMSMGMTGC